jgi:hypothetical protein
MLTFRISKKKWSIFSIDKKKSWALNRGMSESVFLDKY